MQRDSITPSVSYPVLSTVPWRCQWLPHGFGSHLESSLCWLHVLKCVSCFEKLDGGMLGLAAVECVLMYIFNKQSFSHNLPDLLIQATLLLLHKTGHLCTESLSPNVVSLPGEDQGIVGCHSWLPGNDFWHPSVTLIGTYFQWPIWDMFPILG